MKDDNYSKGKKVAGDVCFAAADELFKGDIILLSFSTPEHCSLFNHVSACWQKFSRGWRFPNILVAGAL